MLGYFEYVFEEQQAYSALVERRERKVAAVLDDVVHEPAEVELAGQDFAVLQLELRLEFLLGGGAAVASSTCAAVGLDIDKLVL